MDGALLGPIVKRRRMFLHEVRPSFFFSRCMSTQCNRREQIDAA